MSYVIHRSVPSHLIYVKQIDHNRCWYFVYIYNKRQKALMVFDCIKNLILCLCYVYFRTSLYPEDLVKDIHTKIIINYQHQLKSIERKSIIKFVRYMYIVKRISYINSEYLDFVLIYMIKWAYNTFYGVYNCAVIQWCTGQNLDFYIDIFTV